MGVRSRVWLASAIPISVATAAAAAPVRGPYVALGGGVDFLQNEQLPADPGIGSPSRVLHFVNPGVTGEGSVGWGFGNGFRIEIEGDYFNDHNRKISVPFDGPRRVGGFQQLYGGFLNALYDIPLRAPVTPYLGLGIGGQALSNNNYNTSVPGYAFGPSRPNHQVAGALAYQAIAGFSWPVAAVPGLSLTTEYRLVGLVDPLPAVHVQSTSQRLVIPSNPLPFFPAYGSYVFYSPSSFNFNLPYVETVRTTGNQHFTNIFHHSVTFGLRYAFNSAPRPRPAPPMPVEPPVPLPARTYLVFFDWDRATLTPRAREIVDDAAASSTRVHVTTIEVDGYADTSHAQPGARGHDYNLQLSRRRADAVRAELVRDGVAAGAIAVHGYGDTHLLVPTGPDAREPQNRRVEIVLR